MINRNGVNLEDAAILIGGEAGQGISRSGSLLGKAFMRNGFHVFGTSEYPSLIRGGHNYYLLRVSTRELHSHDEEKDVIIALNNETATLHQAELKPGGIIIIDTAGKIDKNTIRKDVTLFTVPLTATVKDLGGPDIMRNTVALGALLAILGIYTDILKEAVAATFTKKEVADMNRMAIDRGYNHIKKQDDTPSQISVEKAHLNRIYLSGNDAIALGAVSAGCQFFAAYPMTPTSPILDYMANHDEEAKMAVVQGESEVAVMNMLVGASYGGVRTMAATSGGGFCLMTEALGLAAMAETPVVVNIGQRPGPSTGLATHTAQGELLFAIHASHGEFPRFVLAPGDVDECFYLTKTAFNLADKYQVPALILTDRYLAESEKDTTPFELARVPIDRGKLNQNASWDGEYQRYKITEDGVSPRLIPGTKGATVVSNSNEHKEDGHTTEDPDKVTAIFEKRWRKFPSMLREVEGLEPAKMFGEDGAEVTLVSWGGNKGPILEAIRMLKADGVRVNYLQVIFLEPFPTKTIMDILSKTKRGIIVENNFTSQLGTLFKLHVGYSFKDAILRYDGRPFTPTLIAQKVKEVLGK